MSDELREEYQFDYSNASRNRFAAEVVMGGRLIILEPEVAAAFRDSSEVNAVLLGLLRTMPATQTGHNAPAASNEAESDHY